MTSEFRNNSNQFLSFRLNSTFLQETRSRNVDIFNVNFESIEESSYTINNWISRATHGRIQQLYKPEAVRSARLLLATTMHFNGEWKFAFNQTVAGRFETTPTLSKTVTMMKGVMTIRAGDLVARNGYSGRWIELPYAKNDFSMIIIVPNQRHYLDELVRSVDSNEITKILKQLDSSWKKKVFLDMPKFEVGSTFSFVNALLKVSISLFQLGQRKRKQKRVRLHFDTSFPDGHSRFIHAELPAAVLIRK